MGKYISLYDENGSLRDLTVLEDALANDHSGFAPKSLLEDLRKRHDLAVKEGLGENIEGRNQNVERIINNFLRER